MRGVVNDAVLICFVDVTLASGLLLAGALGPEWRPTGEYSEFATMSRRRARVQRCIGHPKQARPGDDLSKACKPLSNASLAKRAHARRALVHVASDRPGPRRPLRDLR